MGGALFRTQGLAACVSPRPVPGSLEDGARVGTDVLLHPVEETGRRNNRDISRQGIPPTRQGLTPVISQVQEHLQKSRQAKMGFAGFSTGTKVVAGRPTPMAHLPVAE